MSAMVSPFQGAQFWTARITCMAERHANTAEPGRWRVWICQLDGLEHYSAVQDDFGNLVRVS